jgi:CRISPR-associated endoribonuclease Cas6
MDLVSIVFTLIPQPHPKFTEPVPRWWGHAGHKQLLRVINYYYPELAQEHYQKQGLRPFTSSSLIGHFPNNRIVLNSQYCLRFSACHADVASILLKAIGAGGLLAEKTTIELDYRPFLIEKVATSPLEHPWAGMTSYQNLAANHLVGNKNNANQLSLQISSPMAFKSNDKYVLFPIPELVFGSLLNAWNQFSPLSFDEALRIYAENALAVSKFDLKSVVVPLKQRSCRSGCVGSVTYTSLKHDPYWMGIIHTLSEFALYSGVGISTSFGLGQVRIQ